LADRGGFVLSPLGSRAAVARLPKRIQSCELQVSQAYGTSRMSIQQVSNLLRRARNFAAAMTRWGNRSHFRLNRYRKTGNASGARVGDDVLVLFAETLDAELDFVAGLEEGLGLLAHAYARGCAGGDDVAGVQAHEAA
jgi:hypothetical protein